MDAFFDEWEIPVGITKAITSLHTLVWAKDNGCNQAIVSKTGGRQGCVLGGLLFNVAYNPAMKSISQQLDNAGLTMHTETRSKPLWSSWNPNPRRTETTLRWTR